jgi:cytochrome c
MRRDIFRVGPLYVGILSVALVFLVSATSSRASGANQVTSAAPPASFAVCAACHAVTRNAPARIGPTLFGIGGRQAGTQAGFNYSPAMKASKIRWDRTNLLSYIGQPRTLVPGTRMPFTGLRDKAKAEEITNYLLRLR